MSEGSDVGRSERKYGDKEVYVEREKYIITFIKIIILNIVAEEFTKPQINKYM